MSTIINEFQDANGTPFGVGLPIVKLESDFIEMNLASTVQLAIPKFIYSGSFLEADDTSVLLSTANFPEELTTQGSFTIEMSHDLENPEGNTPIMDFFSKTELTDVTTIKPLLGLAISFESIDFSNIEQLLEVKVSGGFLEYFRYIIYSMSNPESIEGSMGLFLGNLHLGYFIKYQSNWLCFIDNPIILEMLGGVSSNQ